MKLSRVFLLGLLIAGVSAIAEAENANCQHAIVSAGVLDGRGLPVTGMRLDDLRAELGGKPARIISAVEDHAPRRIVVLLDASRAVRGTNNSQWKLALQLAIDVFVKMPPDNQLALVIFSKKIERVVDFDAGRSVALALLGELRAGTETPSAEGHGVHLLDSILAGLKLFRDKQFGDTIYGITSGYDSGSHASVNDVAQALAARGARVFLSVFASSPTPQSGIDIYREALPAAVGPPPGKRPIPVPSWVKANGGNLLTVHSAVHGLNASFEFDEEQKKNLATSLAILYRQILETYRLSLELPSSLEKSAEWKLQLSEPAAREHKDWQTLFTSSLPPCNSGGSTN